MKITVDLDEFECPQCEEKGNFTYDGLVIISCKECINELVLELAQF